MSELISFNSVSQHILPVAICSTIWQTLIYFLKRRNLSNNWFGFTHHIVLTSLSTYYIFKCRNYLSMYHIIPASQRSSVYTGRIGHIFLSYILADIFNNRESFKKLDWIHHIIASIYTITGLIINPYAIEGPFIGLQELSSIFLYIIYLGVNKPWTRIMFVLSFLSVRIGFGGYVAIMRTHNYINDRIPINLIVSIIWWIQFCLNSKFAYIILKKLCVSKK